MKLNCYGQTFDLRLEKDIYTSNQNLAIIAFEKDDDYYPFAILTVNTSIPLPDNQAFVDVNNCEWAEKFIEENKLGKPTGLYESTQWVNYQLYEFDMSKIEVIDGRSST